MRMSWIVKYCRDQEGFQVCRKCVEMWKSSARICRCTIRGSLTSAPDPAKRDTFGHPVLPPLRGEARGAGLYPRTGGSPPVDLRPRQRPGRFRDALFPAKEGQGGMIS